MNLKKKKILIVSAEYYSDISMTMENNAIDFLKKWKGFSVDDPRNHLIKVPGVFEIPVTISKNVKKYEAFIALGCVIKGETPHFDFISKAAIDLAHTNAEINGYAEQHEAVVSDVLQHLKNEGADFDIIILDPPAFSKSRKTIHNAIQGYKRLNARAISNMKSGGLIFTFSCSQHMSAQLFEDTIRAAAIETGRPVRIVERLSQPADHPVNIYHPEGAYLKGLILAID